MLIISVLNICGVKMRFLKVEEGGGGGKNAFGGGEGNGRYPLTHPKHTHLKVLISLTPFRL